MKTKITKVHHLPVCLGKWIFVKLNEPDINGLRFKPLIVSETEEKQDGDKVFVYSENGYGIWEYKKAPCPLPYWGSPDNCYKILVMPEELSISQLFAIQQGDIKDGDEVWIECSLHEEWLKENPPFDGPYNGRSPYYYQLNLSEPHSIFNRQFLILR